MTGLSERIERLPFVLGRAADCDLRLEDPALSRRHCRIREGTEGLLIEDLGSRNGTFVDGRAVGVLTDLAEGTHIICLGGATLVKLSRQDPAEHKAVRELYECSILDPLTGIHNRRYLERRLGQEHAYASRHRTALSLLLIDVDHFKQVNDLRGHRAGDAALKHLAALLASSLRREDLAARYGGEEFAILARAIAADGAGRLAERVRRQVEDTPLVFEANTISLTVSIGVATEDPPSPRGYGTLLDAADQALYRAKTNGRNRCESP
jgi:diguanylate cyclase (GGDEF)-like protein